MVLHGFPGGGGGGGMQAIAHNLLRGLGFEHVPAVPLEATEFLTVGDVLKMKDNGPGSVVHSLKEGVAKQLGGRFGNVKVLLVPDGVSMGDFRVSVGLRKKA